MKTTSIMIQSLCVPCFNRCKYCLLSWDGNVEGASWQRSINIARRFLKELEKHPAKIRGSFSFGYSMEHPNLKEALVTLRQLNSPMTSFLQCDGMKMRDEAECYQLMKMLIEEKINQLNFTIYGLKDYHDNFASRKGDFDLLIRMMKAAKKVNLPFSISIPLTTENINQVNELVNKLEKLGSSKISLFIPHEEGKGKNLKDVRLRKQDLSVLSLAVKGLLNEELYRCEADWLKESNPIKDQNRTIIISLRKDNIEYYESKSVFTIIEEIEKLDEKYYASFPSFIQLAKMYGDYNGEKLYRIRDLYYYYRQQYACENDLDIYDVTDERQSGSRRY